MPIITPAYPCMNSSYNVSTSTLRVMMEQFQNGNKICQDIEFNKTNWSMLFEPYRFFESYRNYLQLDIIAMDSDDLRLWKGWVESRLRLLTLKIERDTSGVLQCHPYPTEYVDTSKPCAHCAFFMGLQRKEGVEVQEGQQFDIRGTVDEFRHSVNMYTYWKPGMEIYVSHVRRKQIPSFVFPEGHRRPRSSRNLNHADEECENGSGKSLKRKNSPNDKIEGNQMVGKRASVSPEREKVSPEREKLSLHTPGSAESNGGASTESIKVESSPDSAYQMEVSQEEVDVGCTGNAENVGQDINEESPREAVTLESQHISESEQVMESGSFPIELESNASLGGVLKPHDGGGVTSESMQKPVIRLSLTSIA